VSVCFVEACVMRFLSSMAVDSIRNNVILAHARSTYKNAATDIGSPGIDAGRGTPATPAPRNATSTFRIDDRRDDMSLKVQLRQLTSDTAVYGISTILGRFLNFLLVPFYTNVFPAAEYGYVTVVYSIIAFLNVVYTFGLEPAYMRFLEQKNEDERRELFSTAFWAIATAALTLTMVILVWKEGFAAMIGLPARWLAIVPLAAGTLAMDALNAIPFASLRMEKRARAFASIRFGAILINIALNLWFVLGLRMSIVAVFGAGIIASFATTLMLLPVCRRQLVFRIDTARLREMLAFGLPTLPAGLAAMVTQVIDRPLMMRMVDPATAGIYGANYRLGIFMMLVVTMFQFAWQPFYLQHASAPNAKPLFARVMTYFVFISLSVVLLVSFFIDDAATMPLPGRHALLGREYWSGLGIVPIVLFSYVWTGMSVILNAGLLIQKKTFYLAIVTAAGAVVNIAVNLLLIPRIGMYGGAIATLAAYMTMAALYWFITRTAYAVPYEYARLLKLFAAFSASAAAWYLIPAGALPQWLVEVGLLLAFPAILLLMRFFQPDELRELRRMGFGKR
jgi:O-antigen/teichoic acid export membrane protein